MRLEIPEATPSLNQMLRRHWAVDRKLKKHWLEQVWAALLQAGYKMGGPPMSKVRIGITRTSPRLLDADNCVGGIKHLIDALRTCGVIVDDTPEHIELYVRQEKGRPASTVIELESA